MDLKGKTAIVTGGAIGIGANYIHDMLKEGVTKVAIFDVNVAEGEATCKKFNAEFGAGRVCFFKCDVMVPTEFESCFKTVVDNFKKVDILINNAGILNDGQWEKMIGINVCGVVHGVHIGMKYMTTGSTIINIASILGLAPMAGCPVYVATKHAVIGMTRSWGLPFHYQKHGIRFMAMCPGVTDTDLISGAGKRQQTNDTSDECDRELSSLVKQPTSNVSQGLIHMLKIGENGSIWVSEASQPVYQVCIPEREDMKKKC